MKISSWIIILLSAFCAMSIMASRSLVKENDRLYGNIATLYSEIDIYKVNDSLNAAGIDRLLLTQAELKKYNSDLTQTVEDLDIKLKRVQSISRTATETVYDIKTIVRDSLVYRQVDNELAVAVDTLRCINYSNKWVYLSGCYWDNDAEKIQLKIVSRDTLDQVVHRVPKKFLFFRFGCKAIRQEILSKNPNSHIVYTKYIELKRKR